MRGLNLIGLKRKKIDNKTISKIQNSYNKIFNKQYPIIKNIEKLNEEEKSITEVKEIIEFITHNLKRGICNT